VLPLIFDLDGTLIDSAPDIHAAANKLMDHIGQTAFEFNEIRSFIGNGVPVLVARMMTARCLPDALDAEMTRLFLMYYEADPAKLTEPYPNAIQALEVLAQRGHRLGLCTNKPVAPTRQILVSLGMENLFSAVVGGDTLAVRKPNPEPLWHTLKMLGETICFYVGDSEIDAETAKMAGMPFVLFTQGYRKAALEDIRCHATFNDFNELPAVIGRMATDQ